MTQTPETPSETTPDHDEIVCPFTVAIDPPDIRPGQMLTFTFPLLDPDHSQRLVGLEIVLEDAEGTEQGRTSIVYDADHLPSVEELLAEAPHEPGLHQWRARLDLPEPAEDEEPFEVAADIDLEVGAHRPGVSVWDVPRVVEPGQRFRFHVGIKCPLGCDATGWAFAVRDGEGRELSSGAVGQENWPGTESLRFAEVELEAPGDEGLVEWSVAALAHDHTCAHVEHSTGLRVHVGPPAVHRLRVQVLDAVSREPVARAKVVAHPYRAITGADGIAELRLPSGNHKLFVSGHPYFAVNSELEVSDDLDFEVELHVDREFGIEDAYA